MDTNMVENDMDQNHHEIEEEISPNGMTTLTILRVELKSFKVQNERLMRKQEEQEKLNTMLLQNLSCMQGLLQHASTSGDTEENHDDKIRENPHKVGKKIKSLTCW